MCLPLGRRPCVRNCCICDRKSVLFCRQLFQWAHRYICEAQWPVWGGEVVPCARYFSFEANIYLRGFLDMRVLPFSYPHPFLPPSLPWVCSSELKTTTVRDFVRETSLGNPVWPFFLNSVSGPGAVPGHRGPPTWRPRGTVSLSLLMFFCGGLYPLGTWEPGRNLLGVFCFCFSLAVTRHNFSLHYFIWFCIILCFIESIISLHLAVTHISHSCCICFSFVKNIHSLCCWFNGFSLLFVPHSEGSFPLLDPGPGKSA
jgi:hypothetical protein